MSVVSGLLIMPLFCLGVFLLTGLAILLVLRRGTQTIQASMAKVEQLEQKLPAENSAGDGKSNPDSQSEEMRVKITLTTCPACGAENPAGQIACSYCGSKLAR